MPAESELTGEPDERWVFDQGVTDVFDDMLARSIPQYDVMRTLISELVARGLVDGDTILDLGCSRGEALRGVLDHPDCPERVLAVGCEVSPPMIAAARDRFADDKRVSILAHDLRSGLPSISGCGAVLAVLTVMFVPIQYRLALIRACYQALRPGGRLLLVEKLLGATAEIDAELVAVYHGLKHAHGYSQDEIERKRLALEGVQVPVTAAWNEDSLRAAGFVHTDTVWRWGNFAAWVAIR